MPDEPYDKFTLHEGDLEVTSPGGENPYGYSYRVEGEDVTYYDSDGDPVRPDHRPITEEDLVAATRAFKLAARDRAYLEQLIERHANDEKFAGAVIVKAVRRALKNKSES